MNARRKSYLPAGVAVAMLAGLLIWQLGGVGASPGPHRPMSLPQAPMLAAMGPVAPPAARAAAPPPILPAEAPSDLAVAPAEPAPAQAQAPPTRVLRMRVTAYCPCRICCGRYADGITASGRHIFTNNARFVAADTTLLPFDTRLSVPGYHGGSAVPVLDRGRVIKGHRLDVFFLNHAEAKAWGTRWLDVVVHEG